jgi:ABC-type proline/glycine betaine transport system ATPase subunit
VRLATEVLRGIAEKKEGKVMYDARTLETCSSEQLLALRNQLLSELIRR